MLCPHCGSYLDDDAKFCTACGTKLTTEAPPPSSTPAPTYTAAPSYAPSYAITEDSLPLQYKPLSPWAYFGYNILFAIPLIGFICLIVFSFSTDNINRRNYARSFWCALLLALIIVVIMLALGLSFGFASELFDRL